MWQPWLTPWPAVLSSTSPSASHQNNGSWRMGGAQERGAEPRGTALAAESLPELQSKGLTFEVCRTDSGRGFPYTLVLRERSPAGLPGGAAR